MRRPSSAIARVVASCVFAVGLSLAGCGGGETMDASVDLGVDGDAASMADADLGRDASASCVEVERERDVYGTGDGLRLVLRDGEPDPRQHALLLLRTDGPVAGATPPVVDGLREREHVEADGADHLPCL